MCARLELNLRNPSHDFTTDRNFPVILINTNFCLKKQLNIELSHSKTQIKNCKEIFPNSYDLVKNDNMEIFEI